MSDPSVATSWEPIIGRASGTRGSAGARGAAARGEVNPDDLRADKLLDDIRKERNRTSREREKLEKARARLETQTQALDTRLDKMEDERREMLARARAEGELEVAVLKENIAALKAQLRKARQPLDALKEIEQKVEEIQEKIAAPVDEEQVAEGGVDPLLRREAQHAKDAGLDTARFQRDLANAAIKKRVEDDRAEALQKMGRRAAQDGPERGVAEDEGKKK